MHKLGRVQCTSQECMHAVGHPHYRPTVHERALPKPLAKWLHPGLSDPHKFPLSDAASTLTAVRSRSPRFFGNWTTILRWQRLSS